MRILWSIHLYPPRHNCGSEMVAHNLNKYLVEQGHHVRVILHHYHGDPYMYEGVEVFPANGKVEAFAWANIIFTHLDKTQFTMVMAASCRRPLVHFVHNDIGYECIINSQYKQYIVYNSDWTREKIRYPHPSITLHPPCDKDFYTVPNEGDAITLISLNERKGGYLFSKIAEAMPDRKFIGVIGSYDNPGAMKLNQEQIVAMMPPNVEIVANSPDILSVYRRTRILLMPSDYESWGRTATEAMCSGIPVICTPTPGLKENCQDAAVYVGTPIEDPEPGEACVKIGMVADWVAAIHQVETNYEKYSLLCKARAQQLDPKAELEAVHAFIHQAAANHYQ